MMTPVWLWLLGVPDHNHTTPQVNIGYHRVWGAVLKVPLRYGWCRVPVYHQVNVASTNPSFQLSVPIYVHKSKCFYMLVREITEGLTYHTFIYIPSPYSCLYCINNGGEEVMVGVCTLLSILYGQTAFRVCLPACLYYKSRNTCTIGLAGTRV